MRFFVVLKQAKTETEPVDEEVFGVSVIGLASCFIVAVLVGGVVRTRKTGTS